MSQLFHNAVCAITSMPFTACLLAAAALQFAVARESATCMLCMQNISQAVKHRLNDTSLPDGDSAGAAHTSYVQHHLSAANAGSPVDTSGCAANTTTDAMHAPNSVAAAGFRSNSGRTLNTGGLVPGALGSAYLSGGPSSGTGSVHTSNGPTANVVKAANVHVARNIANGAATGAMTGTTANEMNSMIHAIELLNVVQSDTVWQSAERTGGSLKGGPAALLTALQSRQNESSVQKVQEQFIEDEPLDDHPRARKKRSPSSAIPAAAADAGRVPTGNAPGQHRQFAYPGSMGATFVRVAHRPQAKSLQDKVLNAEAGLLGAGLTEPAGAGRYAAPLRSVEGLAHALPDAPLPGVGMGGVMVTKAPPAGISHSAHSMHSMHAHPATLVFKHEVTEAAAAGAPISGGNVDAGCLWASMDANNIHAPNAFDSMHALNAQRQVHTLSSSSTHPTIPTLTSQVSPNQSALMRTQMSIPDMHGVHDDVLDALAVPVPAPVLF